MRPPPPPEAAAAAAATTAGAGLHGWHTPIPYLFGGLALMLGLIALALVILACSYRKTSNSSTTSAEEKPARPLHAPQPEMEPKIVVIMAGDEEPTYLARPLSSSTHHEQI